MRFLGAIIALLLLLATPVARAGHVHGIAPLTLDGIPNLTEVYANQRTLNAYSGPLYNICRDYDGACEDVYGAPVWPDTIALRAWLMGSTGYINTWYTQSGDGCNFVQSNQSFQPFINVDGPRPVTQFDGALQFFSTPNCLNALSTNAGGMSAAFARLHTTTYVSAGRGQYLAQIAAGTGVTRASIGYDTNNLLDSASGRRLDGDSLVRTTGLPLNNSWDVEIGRWNWASAILDHQTSGANDNLNPFKTSGLTSNTAPTGGSLANGITRGNECGCFISAAVFSSSSLSDSTAAALSGALATLETDTTSTNQFLKWGNAKQTGTYTLAPGLTNFTVIVPDGTTPSYSDLYSFWYHHHTRVATHNGRVWVAYSGAACGEQENGEITEVTSSADNWATNTGPIVVVPPMAPFDTTICNGSATGNIVTYPRAFVVYNGDLYLTAAQDMVADVSVGANIGQALYAVKCNDDGTIGSLFRISTDIFTPSPGFTTPAYDPVLGPALFPSANLYGPWGGSTAGYTPSTFTGFLGVGAQQYVEPSTFRISGNLFQRVWRKQTGNMTIWMWSSLSADGGNTWSIPSKMDVPSAASATGITVLSDGRIAMVFNPHNLVVNRDPLALALFDGTTGALISVYAVRQGLSGLPLPCCNNGQGGGAAYPDIWQDGATLWVSYSIAKQTIGVTSIPLSGL